MSADIIQFRDFQNPRDLERMRHQQALEQMALEVMGVVFPDTSPCDMPFHAPENDSA